MLLISFCVSDLAAVALRIAADNRDEWLQRPSTYAAWHDFPAVTALVEQLKLTPGSAQYPLASPMYASPSPTAERSVVSGLDGQVGGGGTWFGATASGSFGFLTNVEEVSDAPKLSRGMLAKQWLSSESKVALSPSTRSGAERISDYLTQLGPVRNNYAGFNLLIGALELDECGQRRVVLGYLTNRAPANGPGRQPHPTQTHLPHGGRILAPLDQSNPFQVTGMSNSTLDDPWDKVLIGQKGLKMALSQPLQGNKEDKELELLERVFHVMATAHPDHAGPDEPPPSYFPEQSEARHERHASVCVRPMCTVPPGCENKSGGELHWYATRVSTVLLVPRDPTKLATFVERDVYRSPPATSGSHPVRVSQSEAQESQRLYRFPVSLA